MFDVEVRNVHGTVTAIGAAGTFTVVIDRPQAVGGGGLGFNGGEPLHLAVAGCISNDLFREADGRGIVLTRVVVTAEGQFGGDPAVSTGISYKVEVGGDAPDDALRDLVRRVDEIAEIPNSLRQGTEVRLAGVTVRPPVRPGPG
jgi:putative redox protein